VTAERVLVALGALLPAAVVGGRSSKVARNLEWMVKTVIEKGLWDPEKEFSDRIQQTTVKREKRRKRGATI
jgi:hypothetical protein